MRKNKWILRPVSDPEAVKSLQRELNQLSEALARALVVRGITTFEQSRNFFRPSIGDLHDPFLMQDMDAAVDRLCAAIDRGEGVLVYGDYDVDGTTATALMVTFLRSFGVPVHYFIPDRFKDGYGLSEKGIDYAVEVGAGLIVALDCGITGHEAARYVRSRGLDLVICDHHTALDTIPEAVAVLDPKRPDCPYPFKELSGCGVGYKLAQAVMVRRGLPPEDAFVYLDLVALSIASDIVPILGENRLLMNEGLRVLKEKPRLGIRKLTERARIDLDVCSTSQIVFGIGPRINAAGRMGNAGRAVDLMIETNERMAEEQAARLEYANVERRRLDKTTVQQAVEMVEHSFATCVQDAIVLHRPDWHLGVIGIVASRLVERFYRPTVMLCSVNGEVKGSARSIQGFNIYDALKDCDDLLTQFGGHMYAAGMTLPPENVADFQKRFHEVVRDRMEPETLIPELEIDAPLHLDEITPRFWAVLQQFAPFGPQNRNLIFMGQNLQVIGKPTIVGSGGHLKFRVAQQDHYGNQVFDVIGFEMHEHLPAVRSCVRKGGGLEMLFSVEENSWNGQRNLQLRARDLRVCT